MKTWDWPFKIWWLINFLGRRIGKGIFLDFGLKKKEKKKLLSFGEEAWFASLLKSIIPSSETVLNIY